MRNTPLTDAHVKAGARIVAKAADFYLRKKYGMAIDTVQTLREQLMLGRSVAWSLEDPAVKRANAAAAAGGVGTTPR